MTGLQYSWHGYGYTHIIGAYPKISHAPAPEFSDVNVHDIVCAFCVHKEKGLLLCLTAFAFRTMLSGHSTVTLLNYIVKARSRDSIAQLRQFEQKYPVHEQAFAN